MNNQEDTRKGARSLRKFFINFLVGLSLALFGCMIGLSAIEIGLRIFLPLSTSSYQYSPLYGWELIPNKTSYWTEETEKPVGVKINSKGLRDREFSYTKRAGVFRILMLGDSFTEAPQVPLEFTATKHLESLLNTGQKNRSFEVINCGIDGYGTGQEFLFLKHEGVKYNPDLIMVNFFANDICDNVDPSGGIRPLFFIKNGKLASYPFEPGRWSKIRKMVRWQILANSHLASWVKKRIRSILLNAKASVREGDEYILVAGVRRFDVNFQEIHEGIEITKALLSEISGSSGKIGAKFIVFLIPSPFQLLGFYPDNMGSAVRRSNSREIAKNDTSIFDEISSYLGKKGILYINPLDEFKAGASQQKVLYNDLSGHWTIEGHRLAAKIMYDYLIENQLIPIK